MSADDRNTWGQLDLNRALRPWAVQRAPAMYSGAVTRKGRSGSTIFNCRDRTTGSGCLLYGGAVEVVDPDRWME